jgi:hypothetical protein
MKDDANWVQLDLVKQVIILFKSFRNTMMVPLEVLAKRPDNICEVIVHVRQVPLMANNFKDISIFAHEAIVATYYRVFPEPHFFSLQGSRRPYTTPWKHIS